MVLERTISEEHEESEDPGGSQTITSTPAAIKKAANPWKIVFNKFFNSISAVAAQLMLDQKQQLSLEKVTELYHMRITRYYFSLINDLHDENDPIRMQCVPSTAELHEEATENIDPLGEEHTSPVPYLVHRYPDRALLLVTGRCFMYCRHCTRKRLWKEENIDPSLKQIDQAIAYLARTTQIREVIISGGDPLTLPTPKLDYILSAVSRIPHIQTMRIGTRTPVVYPERIDEQLCAVLQKYENLWINIQFNHPREVTNEATKACRKLQRCGIPLSNQSVLLKGINDDLKTMKELLHKLQSIQIRPYYLFQCDPVVGATHFRTSVWKGVELMENLRGHTSGMCLPTFVIDGVDGKGKIPVGPNYLLSVSDKELTLRNYNNEVFKYTNPQ